MLVINETQKSYTERDWKLFRKHIGKWQERYMEQLNQEYIAILNQDKHPSEKFWELEKRIHVDRRKPDVIIEMSRSKLISNILELLRDEVITINDLDEFSDTLKETIQYYT